MVHPLPPPAPAPDVDLSLITGIEGPVRDRAGVRQRVRGLAQLPRRLASVLLLAGGLAGALAGGWLIGRWCLGLVLISESAGAAVAGLLRDDGAGAVPPGARTIGEVLDQERNRP